MKTLILLLISFLVLPAAVPAAQAAAERLGTVSFEVSCAPAVHTSFVRGVALLHDFWYQEAQGPSSSMSKAWRHPRSLR